MTRFVILIVGLMITLPAYAGNKYAKIDGKVIPVDSKRVALQITECPCGQEPIVVSTHRRTGDRPGKVYTMDCKPYTGPELSWWMKLWSPFIYGYRVGSLPASNQSCSELIGTRQPLAVPGSQSTPPGVNSRSAIEERLMADKQLLEDGKRESLRIAKLEQANRDEVEAKEAEAAQAAARAAKLEATLRKALDKIEELEAAKNDEGEE